MKLVRQREQHGHDEQTERCRCEQTADHCNTVLAAGRADLCVLARQHLREPYFTLEAARRYEYFDQPWPAQYLRAAPPQSTSRGDGRNLEAESVT